MIWLSRVLLVSLLLASAACGTSAPPRSGGRITLVEEGAYDERFVIQRATFEEALARGPSWFIQRVRVDPVVVDERFYGFRVRSILPDVPGFDRQSIVPGDIVQRVNGRPIGRPEQFMAVWESLSGARHLSVRVLRDGRPMRITWIVREDTAEASPADR